MDGGLKGGGQSGGGRRSIFPNRRQNVSQSRRFDPWASKRRTTVSPTFRANTPPIRWGVACKDNRKVIASSFAGVAFSLLTAMLIENTVSPIVNGTINMSSFIDAFWASLIAQVEEISIATVYYMIPAAFGFVALWTILYNATLPEKEKAERLKMIG
jgi:hypothetical protein